MRKRISEFALGDMRAVYETDESGQVGLTLVPETLPDLGGKKERSGVDSLVQVKIAGDIYQGCYAPGNTLRDSETVHRLRLASQNEDRNEQLVTIETILEDRGSLCPHLHDL